MRQQGPRTADEAVAGTPWGVDPGVPTDEQDVQDGCQLLHLCRRVRSHVPASRIAMYPTGGPHYGAWIRAESSTASMNTPFSQITYYEAHSTHLSCTTAHIDRLGAAVMTLTVARWRVFSQAPWVDSSPQTGACPFICCSCMACDWFRPQLSRLLGT